MLRDNTQEIITQFIDVTKQYDALKRNDIQISLLKKLGLLGKINDIGIDTKIRFLQMMSTINADHTAEETFIKIYQFYKNSESIDSRLIDLIEKKLALLVGVKIPDFVCIGKRNNASDIRQATDKFTSLADEIAEKLGIEIEKDHKDQKEIPLKRFA